ncbi:hypothetical protein HC928_16390 [bacterium]|nr:hypothetical protein [bacterium]
MDEVLAQQPDHARARTLIDPIVSDQIRQAVNEGDRALEGAELQVLVSKRDQLNKLEHKIERISDTSTQRKLRGNIQETLEALELRITKVTEQQKKEARARTCLDQARNHASSQQYEEALQQVEAARAIALLPEIDALISEYRREWIQLVKKRVNKTLDATPADPATALAYLDTLRANGLEDVETARLRRQAERLQKQEEGRRLYNNAEYTSAITALQQADLTSAEVVQLLEQARAAEAQRLEQARAAEAQRLWQERLRGARQSAESRKWQTVLDILQGEDTNDPEVADLLARSRGEIALAHAQQALQAKDFIACAEQLDNAVRVPVPDIQQRATVLREQLEKAQIIFRKLEQEKVAAQQHYAEYSATGNRLHLREAVKVLDEALKESTLPSDDSQRHDIQQIRDTYQRQYITVTTEERQSLLESATKAIRTETLDGLQRAFQLYTGVLSIDKQDKEGLAGQQKVREELHRLRDGLVRETTNLLNKNGSGQRGVKPSDIYSLLQRIHVAQRIPDIESKTTR